MNEKETNAGEKLNKQWNGERDNQIRKEKIRTKGKRAGERKI